MTTSPQELDSAIFIKMLFDSLLDIPLYSPVSIGTTPSEATILALRAYNARYDRYCPSCKGNSTFKVDVDMVVAEEARQYVAHRKLRGIVEQIDISGYKSSFSIQSHCSRNEKHRAAYHFEPKSRVAKSEKPTLEYFLEKIGQCPSLRDVQLGNLKRFKEGLSDAQRREFAQAISLSAHGYSVAACVHYRRIFETILSETRDQAMLEDGRDDWPEYAAASTPERIKLLDHHLPEFMVEHPHIYNILSAGIHSLTEEECASEIPMLGQAIEMIAEERAERKNRAKRKVTLSKMLAQNAQKLSGK